MSPWETIARLTDLLMCIYMRAYRCVKLYARCRRLVRGELGGISSTLVLSNDQAFKDFYWAKRVVILERYRLFRDEFTRRTRAQPKSPIVAKGSYGNSDSSMQDDAETKTMVNISRVGHCIVVTVSEYIWTVESAGDVSEQESEQQQEQRQSQASPAPLPSMPPTCIFIHQDEINEILRVVLGGEVRGTHNDAVVAEYIWKHITLVKRCPLGVCVHDNKECDKSSLSVGEKVAVIPPLNR